jgi:hypothetical protein
MKISNTQAGPRGINSATGPVLIEPGQTVDIDVSDADLKVAKATGWFKIDGASATKSDEEPSERDELKKQADELGIEYAKNIPTDKLKELVDAKLAE